MKRYSNTESGRPAYHPRALIKIVLVGYGRWILSSRKLEKLCHENVLFMALSGDNRPDHCSIAAFVSREEDAVKNLFIRVLLICGELDLTGGEVFAPDGCKITSNASRQWSGELSVPGKRESRWLRP